MKNFTFLLIICVFFSLQEKKKIEKKSTPINLPITKIGKKYFNYDSVFHYQIDIHDSSINELESKRKSSNFDKIKRDIIIGDIPKSISDKSFLDILEKVKTTKTLIDSNQFSNINYVFSERIESNGMRINKACAIIYRDILVFKKAKKVTGVAKICFGCGGYQIVGTKYNTEHFQEIDTYSKLAYIVK